jgi:methyl-accepting chemotaxis protein
MVSICDNTGRSIYDVSKKLDAVRIEMVKNRVGVSNNEMIDIYKTDHLLWRWRVYNMLLGYEKVDIKVVGDYKGCRLGKWYYDIDCSKIRDNKAFIELEKPHMELHEIAREAVLAFEHGDLKKAEMYLGKMENCSKKVIDYLEQIKSLY